MLKVLHGVFFCLLLSNHAQALSKAVEFFRQPQAPFPSGQASLEELQKSEMIDGTSNSDRAPQEVTVTQDRETYRISSRDVISLQDFVDLRHRPWEFDSMLFTGINCQVLTLRSEPNWKSETALAVPRLTHLRVLEFTKNKQGDLWLKVATLDSNNLVGYVEASAVILAADFMEFLRLAENDWRRISHRDFDHFVLTTGQKIPLTQVQSLLPKLDLGIIVRSSSPENLKVLSHVQLPLAFAQNPERRNWRRSHLAGHGIVYWLPPSTQEIVSDVEFAQASLGSQWQENSQGQIVVADKVSFDKGQHFKPFLRWDEIAHLLQIRLGSLSRNHSHIQIESSQWHNDQNIVIKLRVGSELLQLEGRPFLASTWHFVNHRD